MAADVRLPPQAGVSSPAECDSLRSFWWRQSFGPPPVAYRFRLPSRHLEAKPFVIYIGPAALDRRDRYLVVGARNDAVHLHFAVEHFRSSNPARNMPKQSFKESFVEYGDGNWRLGVAHGHL